MLSAIEEGAAAAGIATIPAAVAASGDAAAAALPFTCCCPASAGSEADFLFFGRVRTVSAFLHVVPVMVSFGALNDPSRLEGEGRYASTGDSVDDTSHDIYRGGVGGGGGWKRGLAGGVTGGGGVGWESFDKVVSGSRHA